MYRTSQDKVKLNLLFNNGGIGDIIGAIPAMYYIHKYHPQVFQTIWVGTFAVEFVQRSLPRDERIVVKSFLDIKEFDQTAYTRCIGYGSTHTNFASHITRHAFSMIVNVEPELKDMNYLPLNQDGLDISRLNLPERFVAINVGHTSAVREMLPEYINEISRYLANKGYTPVYMGKAESPNGAGHVIKGHVNKGLDTTLGVDIRDMTSLCEAQLVIAKASAMVGLDCGLLHVAGTTEVPIVGGFTSVKPMHRMPVRHDELGWNYYPVFPVQSNTSCGGCQSNLAFTVGHRFDTCYYQDRNCLTAVKPSLYIEQLEKVLK